MTKNDVTRTSNSNVAKQRPFQRFIELLELEAMDAEGALTGKEISMAISEQMFLADSLEDAIALQDSGVPNGKDLVDVEQRVLDFQVFKSDSQFQDSTPLKHYVRVQSLRFDTMEEITWATGAPNVVNILWKARRNERLPLDCVIRSRPTANGELLSVKLLAPRPVVVAA